MPLDAGHSWNRATMITGTEILRQLQAAYQLDPDPAGRGGAPAETWLVAGYHTPAGEPARVGVIASVTQRLSTAFSGDSRG
jgi:cyclic pyranopterin phosphate synthase